MGDKPPIASVQNHPVQMITFLQAKHKSLGVSQSLSLRRRQLQKSSKV
ncbi:MAG TPA: hypothetical protein VGL72_04425 [Bryobacteraceae bacterium]|jgi:hypothetical protein